MLESAEVPHRVTHIWDSHKQSLGRKMKSNKLWSIILGSEMLANPSDLHGQEPLQADDSANLKIVPSSLGLAPKLAQASPLGACYARRSSTSRGSAYARNTTHHAQIYGVSIIGIGSSGDSVFPPDDLGLAFGTSQLSQTDTVRFTS